MLRKNITTARHATCAFASLLEVGGFNPLSKQLGQENINQCYCKTCHGQVPGPKSSSRRPVPGAHGHIPRGGTGASLSACARSRTRPPPVAAVGDRHLPQYPGACGRGFQLGRPLTGNQVWNTQLVNSADIGAGMRTLLANVSVVTNEVRWSVTVSKLRARAWRRQGQGLESKLSNAWLSLCANGSQQAHKRGWRSSHAGT